MPNTFTHTTTSTTDVVSILYLVDVQAAIIKVCSTLRKVPSEDTWNVSKDP